MAEAHQTRMQTVVEEMVQSLERDHIRKMQVGVRAVLYFYSRILATTYLNHVPSARSPHRVACSAAVQTAVVALQTP